MLGCHLLQALCAKRRSNPSYREEAEMANKEGGRLAYIGRIVIVTMCFNALVGLSFLLYDPNVLWGLSGRLFVLLYTSELSAAESNRRSLQPGSSVYTFRAAVYSGYQCDGSIMPASMYTWHVPSPLEVQSDTCVATSSGTPSFDMGLRVSCSSSGTPIVLASAPGCTGTSTDLLSSVGPYFINPATVWSTPGGGCLRQNTAYDSGWNMAVGGPAPFHSFLIECIASPAPPLPPPPSPPPPAAAPATETDDNMLLLIVCAGAGVVLVLVGGYTIRSRATTHRAKLSPSTRSTAGKPTPPVPQQEPPPHPQAEMVMVAPAVVPMAAPVTTTMSSKSYTSPASFPPAGNQFDPTTGKPIPRIVPGGPPPPLPELVATLKQQLGLKESLNIVEAVDQACEQLGIPQNGSVVDKAEKCWQFLS